MAALARKREWFEGMMMSVKIFVSTNHMSGMSTCFAINGSPSRTILFNNLLVDELHI